ncbi:MAG: ATP synthase F1 subunit gamma [Chthoniobacteraceae bacterium]|nr:ATP synthase F1 subunit gamma [Chthoniobacteraceae bacterium]
MAANTRDIRRRIKSIKNTAQITKAMQMVASSKMRKAQGAALAGRPYAEQLNKVLVDVQRHADVTLHPLLEVRPMRRELVVVLSTDKGLCGALNTNLLREATAYDAQRTYFVSAGRKGQQHLARLKRRLLADFPLPDAPALRDTRVISKFCIEQFLSGKVDKVTVLYTQFINTLIQKPVARTLLPISPFDLPSAPKPGEAAQPGEAQPAKETAAEALDHNDYLYEPGPMQVLNRILPHYLHFEVYQMALDARASEHSARMVAMKSASDNAQQLIKDLTLEYNKVRQAGITTELLEISTAQIALG